MAKKGKSTKHRKTQGFLATRGLLRLGGRSYGEERTAVRQGHGQGFKRLRATAGQGPNYVGLFCGILGLCWPTLRAMWAHLGAILRPMLTHVEPKEPKNGNSKKSL